MHTYDTITTVTEMRPTQVHYDPATGEELVWSGDVCRKGCGAVMYRPKSWTASDLDRAVKGNYPHEDTCNG